MKKFDLRLLLIALLGSWAFPTLANDLCSDAVTISCGETLAGSTAAATSDSPVSCDVSVTAPGVWYTFEGFNGTATLSTCNDAAFDTKISLFSGSCAGLTCVGGNDDFTGCSGFTSQLSASVSSGTTYYVLVHGFGLSAGSFNLTLSCEIIFDNDLCSGAVPLECGESVSGNTSEGSQDEVSGCGVDVTAPGIWYSFTGVDGQATLSTCNDADFDTKISVYSGSCGSLICEGGNDDFIGCSGFSSQLTVSTTAGTTYYVLVHGFGSASGEFTLSLDCQEITGNDACGGAEPIVCGETVSGSTAEATVDGAPFCSTSNTAPGVWYAFTAASDGLVTASTCNAGTGYDTKLSVFSGSCGDLVCEAGNDDDFDCGFSTLRSTVSWDAVAGTTYYLLVHGFSSASGAFELSLECAEPPANDQPCDAIGLTLGTAEPFINEAATADDGEVSPGGGTDTGDGTCNATDGWCSFETEVQNSVWFTFVAPASGAVGIETDGFDTQLALWEAGDCGDYASFSELGANDDSGPGFSSYLVAACLEPGQTYYVQVDGYNGASGSGSVIVNDLEIEPLACDAGGCQTKFIGYAPAEGLNHLIVTASGGTPPYSYSWTGDGIITSANSNHISVNPTVSTTYTATVTDANGCQTTCSVDVFVQDLTCYGGGEPAEKSGAGNAKVRVCHIPDGNPGNAAEHCVAPASVPSHLAHGDILGDCGNTCLATNPPPPACIPLSIEITTDNYPSETSWELRDGGGNLIASGSNLETASTQTVYEDCVPDDCYSVTLFDSFGDGICCTWGLGNWSVSYGGVTTISPSGGDFDDSETISVGACAVKSAAPVASAPAAKIGTVAEVSAYPNPFSGSATIRVLPSHDGVAVVDIVDLNGQVQASLFQGMVKSGVAFEVPVNGRQLHSNGIYLYRVQLADEVLVGKLVYAH